MKIDFVFLTVAEMICFLLVLTLPNITIKVVQRWLELGLVHIFMLILGWVGFGHLHLWVGLGRVKKIAPIYTSNYA